jgi:hypothetical protein
MSAIVNPARGKNLPAKSHPGAHPPTSAADVGITLSMMDTLYGTKFTEWIRDEENLNFIATIKKYVFEEALGASTDVPAANNIKQVVHVLRWMTPEWSVPSISEIILKLFYHYRLNSRTFADIVAGISAEWREEAVCELVASLLIGESSQTASQFMYNFSTSSMGPGGVHRAAAGVSLLCAEIATCLRWSETFQRYFLFSMADLFLATESAQKEELIAYMRDRLQALKPVAPATWDRRNGPHGDAPQIPLPKVPASSPAVEDEAGVEEDVLGGEGTIPLPSQGASMADEEFDAMVSAALTSLEMARRTTTSFQSFQDYTTLVMGELLRRVVEVASSNL